MSNESYYGFTLRPERPFACFHTDLINWCLANVGVLQCYNMTDSVFSGEGWSLSGADRNTSSRHWQNVNEYYLCLDDEYHALSFKLTWSDHIKADRKINNSWSEL